jgi:hypothetical protein
LVKNIAWCILDVADAGQFLVFLGDGGRHFFRGAKLLIVDPDDGDDLGDFAHEIFVRAVQVLRSKKGAR